MRGNRSRRSRTSFFYLHKQDYLTDLVCPLVSRIMQNIIGGFKLKFYLWLSPSYKCLTVRDWSESRSETRNFLTIVYHCKVGQNWTKFCVMPHQWISNGNKNKLRDNIFMFSIKYHILRIICVGVAAQFTVYRPSSNRSATQFGSSLNIWKVWGLQVIIKRNGLVSV